MLFYKNMTAIKFRKFYHDLEKQIISQVLYKEERPMNKIQPQKVKQKEKKGREVRMTFRHQSNQGTEEELINSFTSSLHRSCDCYRLSPSFEMLIIRLTTFQNSLRTFSSQTEHLCSMRSIQNISIPCDAFGRHLFQKSGAQVLLIFEIAVIISCV